MKISTSAEKYAWRQLAHRAGLSEGFEPLGISFHYGNLQQLEKSAALTVCRAKDSDWEDLLTLPKSDLRWIPASETVPAGVRLSFQNPVPVLFWGEGIDPRTKPFAEKLPDGSVVFYADIIAATLFMLTRWEETVVRERDRHGRFPAAASSASRLGFLDIPVVDQYALILREWIRILLPGWVPQRNVPAINLTHDIDHIHQYSNPISFAKSLGSAAFSQHPFREISRKFRELEAQLFHPAEGENFRAVFDLAEYSQMHGFKSRFYFMAARPSLKQQGYDPALPHLQNGYRTLAQDGHEIGFHPGYDTFKNPELLGREKERLEDACGCRVAGGRQHYLRFEAPHTWRHWEQAGLQYDSTLGYADREGFRCGTCHPFKPFDLELDREIEILEIPLIVMDGTLIDYRKLAVGEAQKVILGMANRCMEVGGVFTLLWHNTILPRQGTVWRNMYLDTLQRLKDMIASDPGR